VYRLKQFIWALNSVFKPIDQKLLDKYLSKEEEYIFNKLSKADRHHSIRVCMRSLSLSNEIYTHIDKNKLAKIALLHDVGKVTTRLNLIDKSVLVILNKISNGKMEKYSSIKKIDVYYNHGKKSARILKEFNKYDNEFLEAIENHHYRNLENNIYLKILKKCDDES
jgi:putative nucleotidyltransferase with HDIG domain